MGKNTRHKGPHRNAKGGGKSFKNKFHGPRGKGQTQSRPHPPPANKRGQFEKNGADLAKKVSLLEQQVGITEYVSKTAGFTAVVKSRFADFQVNEIDRSGKVLHLTDLTVPQLEEETLNEEEVAAARSQFSDWITPTMWDNINALAELKQNDKKAQTQVIDIEVSDLDKDKRTQIHKVLKQMYPRKLVSTTVNETVQLGERKLIRIMKPKGRPGENRIRWTFPGEYVHFLVHKENYDTTEVASTIATRLNLRPSQVNYCGTKDKRAKTTQKFCIKRRTPAQIVGASKLRNVHVGNFEFSDTVLKLGDLNGNRFRIALRHLGGDEQENEKALISLRDNGFINYFGLQRFGNCSTVPTYEIGVALLKADYKLASELILKPRDNERGFMAPIREMWWKERNSAAAAAMFYTDKYIEKKLLDGLAKYGENDYAAALRMIPRNMLLLYPHAFQSLVFNLVASRRIKEFGLDVIVGDLVYRNKDDADDVIVELGNFEDDAETEAATNADDANKEGANNKDDAENDTTNKIDENSADNDKLEEAKIPETTDPAQTESVFKRKVKALTAEDVASGNYTRFDIVLPLPGYDITYPNNEVGKWYEEVLQEFGLTSDKLRHNVKTFAMAGAYRKLLTQPTEMSWQFRTYDTPDRTLIASDWEVLMNKKVIDAETQSGKLKALLLDFCLPTSAYATMLLRDLLKMDTSAAHQTQLEQSEMEKFTLSKQESGSEEVAPVDAEATTPIQAKRKAADDNTTEENEVDAESDAKKLKIDENAECDAKKLKIDENVVEDAAEAAVLEI